MAKRLIKLQQLYYFIYSFYSVDFSLGCRIIGLHHTSPCAIHYLQEVDFLCKFSTDVVFTSFQSIFLYNLQDFGNNFSLFLPISFSGNAPSLTRKTFITLKEKKKNRSVYRRIRNANRINVSRFDMKDFPFNTYREHLFPPLFSHPLFLPFLYSNVF